MAYIFGPRVVQTLNQWLHIVLLNLLSISVMHQSDTNSKLLLCVETIVLSQVGGVEVEQGTYLIKAEVGVGVSSPLPRIRNS